MNMLTKKDKEDIKEIFVDALEPFATAIQTDLNKVHEEFASVNKRLGTVEGDVKEMKTNSGEMFTKLDDFISHMKKQDQEQK